MKSLLAVVFTTVKGFEAVQKLFLLCPLGSPKNNFPTSSKRFAIDHYAFTFFPCIQIIFREQNVTY
jgi:hypothetical protein